MVSSFKTSLSALALVATMGSFSAAAIASEPTPAPEGRKFTYSFNVGATSDYVFRGVSQNKENPAIQGGIDLGYGIAYFGLWASTVDFGRNFDGPLGVAGSKVVSSELDIYGGIKPTWGPATFDLGVIYYAYPGANDGGAGKAQLEEQDYLEFKAGVSGAFIPALPKLTVGGTVYFSPEYQGKQGEVWTTELTAGYELPAIGIFTPTISALYGMQFGDATGVIGSFPVGKFALANGKDELAYWNIGLSLAVEKFTFDFRYWDTDVTNGPNNWCNGIALQCDERFVFSGKFTY
ncbi:MAG: TorF family putative porin [Hyphomicrobiaceae bacterium]